MITNIEDRFILARWTYLCGDPVVSDVEYERTKQEVETQNLLPDYRARTWSFDPMPPDDMFTRNGLDPDKYRLDESIGYYAESIESINTDEMFDEAFKDINEKTRVSFKIDGWNCRVTYVNGYIRTVASRGRNGANLNMNSIFKVFPACIRDCGYDCSGIVNITGELNIDNNSWDSYKLATGNKDQRSSVRTAIANSDWNVLNFLAFNIEGANFVSDVDSYAVLKSLGFKTPFSVFVNNYDQLKSAIDKLTVMLAKYPYLTDGIVVENKSLQLAVRLGGWAERPYSSYVTGYSEEYGLTGTYISVLIRPIDIGGRTISKVAINNIARIEENGLYVDAPIALSLRSSANPVLDEEVTAELQMLWANNYEAYKQELEESLNEE